MKTAMLLAAGRGERLRPLTDHIPKPLCPVNGQALIDYHLIKLAKAGFERVVINHAYLGGMIRQYVGDGQRYGLEICYAPEPPGGLETGGGLFNALPLLGDTPFLAINADIYTDFNFSTIVPEGMRLIHCILVTNPEHVPNGDFSLNAQGLLSNYPRTHTYSGIAWYHPKALKVLSPGRYSIIPLLRHLTDEGAVSGEIYEGFWCDVGTLERLSRLSLQLNLNKPQR